MKNWDRDVDEKPSIDVLVPSYHEKDVIERCIESIRDANYPDELISIYVLLEPDDERTREALHKVTRSYTEVTIPETYPGQPNKPRALNYGFMKTNGDIVGILDAEDICDEEMFNHIAQSMELDDKDFVQGILDMANEDDGWKSVIFRGEYGKWFQIYLPSLAYSHLPVPLGGTTNFCRRDVLEEISKKRKERFDKWNDSDYPVPWAPDNVTEDFELGLFLWMENYELGLIPSITKEESPIGNYAWIRQRTRWEKGKIFTFYEYLKEPPQALNQKLHIYTQSLEPHIGLVNILGILHLLIFARVIGLDLNILFDVLLLLSTLFIGFEVILYNLGYWIASEKNRLTKIVRTPVFFLFWLYWILLWIAEIRGIYQIYKKDLDWEKTEHEGRHFEE